MSVPAGWYADPWRHAPLRWFDGVNWSPATSAHPGWYADPWRQAPLRWFDGVTWTPAIRHPDDFTPRIPDHEAHKPDRSDDEPTGVDDNSVVDSSILSAENDERPFVAELHDEVDHRTLPATNGLAATSPLRPVLGSARRIVVVDVETTGLSRTDRVVEIAIVTLDEHGEIHDEFETLVNPHRDVGPSWIHGLTPSMVAQAPSFSEIALAVASRLDGALVVAHNISFDTRMIGWELERVGIDIHWGAGLDTLRVTGRKLEAACRDHGIALDNAHSAVADARATACLLLAVADRFSTIGQPASTGIASTTPVRLVARDAGTHMHEPAPYLVELARDIQTETDVADYAVLLDRALADLQLTHAERAELGELAQACGLSPADVERAHRGFLTNLVDIALADGIVTDDELDKLARVAALLDLDAHTVTARTNPYRFVEEALSLDEGMSVCFTGDSDSKEHPMTREKLHALARGNGLSPVDSVTAKGCQLLVAVDTATQSRKAKAAHKFGIPIATLSDFLSALSEVKPVPVAVMRNHGVANVCEQCGTSWTASRRARICASCRRKPREVVG